jgi:uncharacterized Zn finger protein/DNA-binding XRE family transcriptional regulator
MSSYYSSFPEYTPVVVRREMAKKHAAALKREGKTLEPVRAATPRGKIALSFWGHAWCRHLESYSDYSNRLPRGRSYLRNGSVLHLAVNTGRIDALVMGSRCYIQTIRIDPLPAKRWAAIKKRCQGKVGSLIELLQGKLSDDVMVIVTDRKDGLFPDPQSIHLDCNCPDWADLCKHLAAILYGLGARLDTAPELLFKLRGVDHEELITADPSALVVPSASGRRTLDTSALSEVFDIELDEVESLQPVQRTVRKTPAKKQSVVNKSPQNSPARGARKTAVKKVPRKRSRAASGNTVGSPEAHLSDFYLSGALVELLRLKLDLTRRELAGRLGVSPQTVANWEKRTGRLNLQPRTHQALAALYADTQA